MRLVAPALGMIVTAVALRAGAAPAVRVVRPAVSTVGDDALRAAIEHAVEAGAGIEISIDRDLRLGTQRVVRFGLSIAGVPIVDRGAGAILGPSGEVRLILARSDGLSFGPEGSLPERRILDAVERYTGLAMDRGRMRRVWWPRGPGLRSAWIAAPAASGAIHAAPVVVVDANSGDLLMFDPGLRSWGEARVFPLDPLRTPNLERVVLPIADGERDLVNDRVEALNCVDRGTLKQVTIYGETFAAHICDFEGSAKADPVTGSFDAHGFEEHDTREDGFAQVSAFHHVNAALERFSQTVPGFEVKTPPNRLRVVSNVMFPPGYGSFDVQRMGDPSVPLDPFRNGAYYGAPYTTLLPAVPLQSYLLLGQGRHVDTSYDASLVYHEVTHAAVSALGGLSSYNYDAQGVYCAPGAIEEGLADYFAAVFSGASAFAPYFVTEFPDIDLSRDVDNARSCPAWLSGEVHEDSMVLSGALWRARRALSGEADRSSLDAVLLATLAAFPTRSIGFEDFALALVAAVASSPLGPEAGAVVEASFEVSGLLPGCTRIVPWEGKALRPPGKGTGGAFIAPGTVAVAANPAPGFFQVRAPVEAGAVQLAVTFVRKRLEADARDTSLGVPSGRFSRFAPAVAVAFDAPISLSVRDGAVVTEADAIVDAGLAADRYSAKIAVPPGARDAFVMIVNWGESSGRWGDMDLAFVRSTSTVRDSSEESGATGERGCGCSAAGTEAVGSWRWLGLLGLLPLRSRGRGGRAGGRGSRRS